MNGRLPSVLVISRAYPNSAFEHQGPWVARQTQALARRGCQMRVVAPTPYWPPLPRPVEFARFRNVEPNRRDGDVEILHPRFVVGPGHTTHALEAISFYATLHRLVKRLHVAKPIELIHAHFSYPDGAAAVALGRALGVPVVVTEHVLWKPWMEAYPLARRQALWAVCRAAACVAVSDAVRRTMREFLPEAQCIRVIPVGVDAEAFPLKRIDRNPDRTEERILFVGWVNYLKGVDVLLQSLRLLIRRRPRVHLTIVGGALFRHKRVQQESLLRSVQELGIEADVTFAGPRSTDGVARFMRRSDLLVLPSRRESCGSVLLEALASGTPVVATRCGGPEEIVTDDVGVLTPVDDADALAAGMERVLENRSAYDPARLRHYALSRFSWERLTEAYLGVYRSVLS
jgi:teichuronic acid biosynthesis glycosyltransferase TuaC